MIGSIFFARVSTYVPKCVLLVMLTKVSSLGLSQNLVADDTKAYYRIIENIYKNRGDRERYFQRDVFGYKEILPMKEFFIRNATVRGGGKPLECVNTVRAGLEILFYGKSEISTNPNRTTPNSLFKMTGTNRIVDAMELLSDSGCINDYKDIFFYGKDRRGDTVIINEQNFSIPGNFDTTISIINMCGSVWHAILSMVPRSDGWSVFSLSISNGYHSVTLLVNHTGITPEMYWADQTQNHLVNKANQIKIPYVKQFGWERFTEKETTYRSLDDYCLYCAKQYLKDYYGKKHMPVFRIFKISLPARIYKERDKVATAGLLPN